ncbi:GNAT family N-acetyltransferase [Streptomyces spinosirectus]|jgi:GNAT superfamily N-acetyltransferase|uniref:GNAT family N-acetyltransferase n=1 Tax=Streptomyces TaxID=1883 RepID=UPI000D3C0B3F|nr:MULTISPECIES: GNAT family N-acetyltransferase [Streptomyces]UIR16963.1 GNAT family N-acetyltransferase [Streptomyces spinosirectus]
MTDTVNLPEGYEISTDPERLDVDRSVRGKKIGTALVGAVRDHLEPFGLRRILLATHDAHGVYEKLGFREPARPDQWMALVFRAGGLGDMSARS